MKPDSKLETYWITFPQDPHLPFGIGVTAYSEEDAFALVADQGVDKWYAAAKEIIVTSGVAYGDLDQSNVAPNIGPMQLRGVWYPIANIGYGAPRDRRYKPPNS